jgi:hypothetical protein
MLRRASFTTFVRDADGIQLREQLPIHRVGAAIFVCNYSSADRKVYVEYSNLGNTWKNAGIITKGGVVNSDGVTVVPRGIVLGTFFLGTENLDATLLRVRLDDTADGDGVFVQIETAAPVPDHPLL